MLGGREEKYSFVAQAEYVAAGLPRHQRQRHIVDLISAFLRPWFAHRTLAQVAAAFTDRSLLWGPYRDFAQMIAEDPRVSEANPMFTRLDHPGYGRFLTTRSPLAFSASVTPAPAPAPRIGADTTAVLQEVLALDDAQIRDLAARGIAGTIANSTDA